MVTRAPAKSVSRFLAPPPPSDLRSEHNRFVCVCTKRERERERKWGKPAQTNALSFFCYVIILFGAIVRRALSRMYWKSKYFVWKLHGYTAQFYYTLTRTVGFEIFQHFYTLNLAAITVYNSETARNNDHQPHRPIRQDWFGNGPIIIFKF